MSAATRSPSPATTSCASSTARSPRSTTSKNCAIDPTDQLRRAAGVTIGISRGDASACDVVGHRDQVQPVWRSTAQRGAVNHGAAVVVSAGCTPANRRFRSTPWPAVKSLDLCLAYNLPVLKSALPLRIADSRLQFSGWTLSHRLPLPRSVPSLSSRLNHSSAVLILFGCISSSRS
jgi:hypothetical protein